ncbi:MAG: glutathione S-transferase N-terminal domain-containing protein [Betaproteobacteria bacterium]
MIELWELIGQSDRRYSTFSWRSRMALRHKHLAFTTQPVLQTDKAAIAFSGGKTVPVIRDSATVVRDSWQIAEYLEQAYPQQPSLFGGPTGKALCLFFNTWVDRSLMPLAFRGLACDAIHIQDPADQDHFRATIEKFTGGTPDSLKLEQAKTFERLRAALDPARAILKRQQFLGGSEPCYADYILFSMFQWARIVSPVPMLPPDDPLQAWFERILGLYDGYARNTLAFY